LHFVGAIAILDLGSQRQLERLLGNEFFCTMKLPNSERAVIAPEKLVDYLLNIEHKRGGAKARLLLPNLAIEQIIGSSWK
jgi:hypothetical protein